MENRLVITTLCAAALVYACGPWIHSNNAAGTAAPRNSTRASTTRNTTHGAAARNAVNGKSVGSVATDFDFARNGSNVDFALHVMNNTPKTVELRFANARTHDVAVFDASGRAVWHSSDGRMYTQTMQAMTVRSRDTLTLEDSWDAHGAHGKYMAVALLATNDHPVERRVEFTLP